MIDVLLLHPPATKPSEPPLSLALLYAYLQRHGVSVEAIDANLEAFHHLLRGDTLTPMVGDAPATDLRRALNHREASLATLTPGGKLPDFPRYQTAVRYLNRLLALHRGMGGTEQITFGDYQHGSLNPFRPEDLMLAAAGEVSTIFDRYYREELIPRIADVKPKRIAISIHYLNQAIPAFALAGMLRRTFPEIELIAGGGLISSWRQQLREKEMPLPPFDRMVFGPGEAPLLRIAKGEAGDDTLIEDASAIAFDPDYSFAFKSRYFSPEPILQLSTSRGCYWQRCRFCPEAATPVHPYRQGGPDAIVDSLIDLRHRYGASRFHLTDNAIPAPVLRAIAQRADELKGISWFGFVRFEQVLEDPALIKGLAAGGCKMLQLGLESGSQRVLDRLEKGIDLARVEKVLANLRAAGIATYVYIMLGTPMEEESDAEATLAFLEAQAERIGFLNIAIMNLPHDSDFLTEPDRFGIAASAPLDQDAPLGLYRSFTPETGWTRAEARRFLEQRILKSPRIKAIINRTPPLFTSNHASFF